MAHPYRPDFLSLVAPDGQTYLGLCPLAGMRLVHADGTTVCIDTDWSEPARTWAMDLSDRATAILAWFVFVKNPLDRLGPDPGLDRAGSLEALRSRIKRLHPSLS